MRDAFKGPVKAAAWAGFIVGALLFVLNPPSLSGAEGLATFIVGGLLLAIFAAWATVTLIGRDAMSEPEFERIVLRSEELARQLALAAAARECVLLVSVASDELRPVFVELLERRRVGVSHRGAEHRAYGHYYGDTVARDDHPDRIIVYQDTLERDFGHDPDLLRAQVTRTLRHELGHHLGWGERGVRELGL